MQLHFRTCPKCNVITVRIHGDTQWFVWRNGAINEQVRLAHQIMSEKKDVCLQCANVHAIACQAGSVT